ncbi:MAG: oligosaccharide biosynthesis protein Alg14 [Rikenellaceae bacterium]
MKILAVASIGGHWIQLLRIAKSMFAKEEVVFMSTHEKCATMIDGRQFHKMSDFSRWDAYKLIPAFFNAIRVVRKEKPDAVITTGAAPGLVVLLAAKFCGVKTIWIDSIANVNKLSMSGKIASKFNTRTYTQWEELATDKIYFAGNVLE